MAVFPHGHRREVSYDAQLPRPYLLKLHRIEEALSKAKKLVYSVLR